MFFKTENKKSTGWDRYLPSVHCRKQNLQKSSIVYHWRSSFLLHEQLSIYIPKNIFKIQAFLMRGLCTSTNESLETATSISSIQDQMLLWSIILIILDWGLRSVSLQLESHILYPSWICKLSIPSFFFLNLHIISFNAFCAEIVWLYHCTSSIAYAAY